LLNHDDASRLLLFKISNLIDIEHDLEKKFAAFARRQTFSIRSELCLYFNKFYPSLPFIETLKLRLLLLAISRWKEKRQ
jgi:hypothetical protein